MERILFDPWVWGWLIPALVIALWGMIAGLIYHFSSKSCCRFFGSVCAAYLSGIVIWIFIGIAILSFVIKYSMTPDYAISIADYLLSIPFAGLIIYLTWNCILSRMENKSKEENLYKEEVELVKFVERHANYLIYGITGVFIAAQVLSGQLKHEANFALFYLFMILSMILSVCGVLPLIWIPKGDDKFLEWLRHFKTIWYGYSIYFFLAGIIALAKAIIKI
ncbi:MAG: hypothetical protein PHH60_01470 [Candidatus Margulisbacteria bacterium]|nr:hypothetical protein [Candidatus Margulisiibacteriota bacterium]